MPACEPRGAVSFNGGGRASFICQDANHPTWSCSFRRNCSDASCWKLIVSGCERSPCPTDESGRPALVPLLGSQESAAQRHGMATNQLKRLAAEMSDRCLSQVRTLDDWKQQRVESRRQLLEMLGLDPLPARTPLQVQVTGRLERDAYVVEKTVFQSLPGLYVTGNSISPKARAKGCRASCICAVTRPMRTAPKSSIRTGPSGSPPMALRAWFWTHSSLGKWRASITARTT